MAARRESDKPKRPPATTPQARENQLIGLAADLVEKKLRNGTATSQEITHLLKRGSSREKLEEERMAMQIQLDKARIEHMEQVARSEELLEKALRAFRSYAGGPEELEDQEFDD